MKRTRKRVKSIQRMRGVKLLIVLEDGEIDDLKSNHPMDVLVWDKDKNEKIEEILDYAISSEVDRKYLNFLFKNRPYNKKEDSKEKIDDTCDI